MSDVDGDDSPSFADVTSTSGDNSYGSFVLVSGNWTYTLDQSAVQDLDAGDTVSDTITFTADDGSFTQISVSISVMTAHKLHALGILLTNGSGARMM